VEKAFTEKKKAFQDANTEAIDRILKAEGKNQTLKGKDAEIQKEWNKWREETAVHAKHTSELRKRVAEDQPIVEISCQDQRNPIDTTAYEARRSRRRSRSTARSRPTPAPRRRSTSSRSSASP